MAEYFTYESPVLDTAVEREQAHEYEPVTGTNLNNPGEIRIVINQQDLYLLYKDAWVDIQGQLTKNDGTVYDNNTLIALINNGGSYLFKSVKLEMGGQVVELVHNIGQASTMLGLLTYPDDHAKSRALNKMWAKDTTAAAAAANLGFAARQGYIINSSDPRGTFSIRIPLSHWFGFADDFDKALYGMKHQLTLERTGDDNAIFRDGGVDAGKITLNKVSLWIPHITPSLEIKNDYAKLIEGKTTIPVAFRSRWCDSISVAQSTSFTWQLGSRSSTEKPAWLILAFATNKENNQETNPSIFDHNNLTNVHVRLNSEQYPGNEYTADFAKMRFNRIFGDASDFCRKYYGELGYSNILPSEFKTLYSIYAFDLTKQSEALKNSVVDIQVRAKFSVNVPADTQAYALIISDKLMMLKADGNSFRFE